MATFVISRATTRDVETVTGLIDEAARWLRTKDTDQWERPWPSAAGRARRILDDIKSGKTWIAWAETVAVATITIEYGKNKNLPQLWSSGDVGPAFSAHRLVVKRNYAGIGLGAALLNWAGDRAPAKYKWMRIDVWTTNMALHEYYERQGFKFVRWHDDPRYPSGALFQRAICDQRAVPAIRFVVRRGPCRYGRGKTVRRARLRDADWFIPPAPLAPLGTVAEAIWALGRSLRSSRG